MWVAEVKRGRRRDGMAEEGTKTEGNELFGLPPRKRFKVMEQRRQREEEEESPRVQFHCNDVTNSMPLHRESRKPVTSQGFLVLEKQKYKLQQQKLPEDLDLRIPPLPPRPVAVKRKEAPALPLSALPTITLKFQGEKVHSLSPSAFKSWGSSSPKLGFVLKASSELPISKDSPSEARKDSGYSIKQHQRDSFSAASFVDHAKAWKMAKGTTCSINKAQEDFEMMVCEVPALSSSTYSSEMYALVPMSTTSSAPKVAMDLVPEGNNGSQVASDNHVVGAAQISELDRMMSKFPSAPMEDVMHEVQDVEEEGRESKFATEIITADLECVLLDDTGVADGSHSSPVNTTTVVEAANVDIPQASDNEELAGNSQRLCMKSSLLPVLGQTLGNPVDRTELSGAMESEGRKESKKLVEVRDSGEAIDRVHATFGVPEACFSQFTDPLTTGSPILALLEIHTSDGTSVISKISEELTVSAYHTDTDKTLLSRSDKADRKACSAGKHEELAAQVVTDALVRLGEVEVVENKGVVATILSDSLAVAGEPDMQEIVTKQDRSLAQIDERADNLFKRMFEREGYEGCKLEQDSIADTLSQFFFAFSGVNDIDSPVVGIKVEGGSTLKSQGLENSTTPIFDDRVVYLMSSEDYEIDLGRPTFNVVEGRYMPPDEMISESPESSSRASQVHEDSAGLEDQEIDSPIRPGLRHGGSRLKEESQESHCKSSKEDTDWDLEMEIPDFSFGKRSGMTQRVKAPGLWLQSSGVDSTNLGGEAGSDHNDGACDICRNPDADPSDPIVYCDGCDVPVHSDCYGNPLSHGVPEGDWFCAQCLNRSPNSRTCYLCPKSGGAMKMTTDGNWAHLSCAVFVPEVFFREADDLEGIDTSHVPSRRWLSTCCVCKSTGGACVDCTEIGCKSSFHISCALKKDLALEFRNGRSGAIVISFCQEHTAAWDEQQEARKAGRSKYKIVSREPRKTKASERSKLR